MFEGIIKFLKNIGKTQKEQLSSKDAAKERLQLVLTQDRANVSADYLDLMKQEIIEVIKKYIDIDENAIDVRLTNTLSDDGKTGAPALYANIPILNVKEKARKIVIDKKEDNKNEKNDETTNNIVNKKETEKKDTSKENKKEEQIKENEPKQENNKNEKKEEKINDKIEENADKKEPNKIEKEENKKAEK